MPMKREIGGWRLLANAGFVIAVLALATFGAGRVASRQWRLQETFRVHADFATIGGVDAGAGTGSRNGRRGCRGGCAAGRAGGTCAPRFAD